MKCVRGSRGSDCCHALTCAVFLFRVFVPILRKPRVHKVCTEQEQNDRGSREVLAHLLVLVNSCIDLTFVPGGDEALTFEHTQVLLQS